MAFTVAELIDLRRFAGYPALAGGVATTVEAQAFETRLAALTTEEQTAVRTVFLVRLLAAEASLVGMMDTADTKQAAVWHRNPNAMLEAGQMLAYWRQAFVDLLGLPLGPFGYGAGPPIPAIFAV